MLGVIPRETNVSVAITFNSQAQRATVDVYSSAYVANKARCNPKDRMKQVYCEEAKADLARVQLARQQELAIYQQMADDPVVNEQDRQVARQSVANLQGNQ